MFSVRKMLSILAALTDLIHFFAWCYE